MHLANELVISWDGDQRVPPSASDAVVAPAVAPVIELRRDSGPDYLGDPQHWNPERLFVASLSHCHMQQFLELCVSSGVQVEGYVDRAVASLTVGADGAHRISEVVLRPRVIVSSPAQVPVAIALQRAAAEHSVLARSVAFPVRLEPALSAA